MSPIAGLTDRAPSFREIARLRKGSPKSQGLKDLTYFRPDFRPDEKAAAATFKQYYGDQPTMINVRLAFPTVEQNWDASLEAYNTTGLLAKTDGVKFIYLRDNKTGRVIVRDGEPEIDFDPTMPIYSYWSEKKKQDIPVFARPIGRLKVLIPELRVLNYVTLITHSWYDCGRISEQLHAIAMVAQNVGMPLTMVPLVLTRRPEQVPCSTGDGGRVMKTMSLVNIDVRPDWAESQFKLLDSIMPGKALPAGQVFPELPTGVPDEDEEQEEESPSDYTDGQPDDDPAPIPAEMNEVQENPFKDLDERAVKDPATAFWMLAKRLGLDNQAAAAVLKDCGTCADAYSRLKKTWVKP
jgi:hypothetical protein